MWLEAESNLLECGVLVHRSTQEWNLKGNNAQAGQLHGSSELLSPSSEGHLHADDCARLRDPDADTIARRSIVDLKTGT